jgi:hypothetical protein
MVIPKVTTKARTAIVPHANMSRSVTRYISQRAKPPRANSTCPETTGIGSLVAAAR